MRYVLVRDGDGAGDSGPMSEIIDRESWTPIKGETRPRVGCAVRVGSPYAHTFQSQGYWTTTPVTEILSESKDSVRFKTNNSIYTWIVS